MRELFSRVYKCLYYFLLGGTKRGEVHHAVYFRMAGCGVMNITVVQHSISSHYGVIHLEPWGQDVINYWHARLLPAREKMLHGGVARFASAPYEQVRRSLQLFYGDDR